MNVCECDKSLPHTGHVQELANVKLNQSHVLRDLWDGQQVIVLINCVTLKIETENYRK